MLDSETETTLTPQQTHAMQVCSITYTPMTTMTHISDHHHHHLQTKPLQDKASPKHPSHPSACRQSASPGPLSALTPRFPELLLDYSGCTSVICFVQRNDTLNSASQIMKKHLAVVPYSLMLASCACKLYRIILFTLSSLHASWLPPLIFCETESF